MSTALLTDRQAFDDTQAAAVAAGLAKYDKRRSKFFNRDCDTLREMLRAGQYAVKPCGNYWRLTSATGEALATVMAVVTPLGGVRFTAETVSASCAFDVAVIEAVFEAKAGGTR